MFTAVVRGQSPCCGAETFHKISSFSGMYGRPKRTRTIFVCSKCSKECEPIFKMGFKLTDDLNPETERKIADSYLKGPGWTGD